MDIQNSGKNDDVNIEEFIQGLRELGKTDNPFQFHKCDDRNIILIGRARTGKSTIHNVVSDITYVSKPHELYSQTRTVQFKTILTDTKDYGWYCFRFIDVPGFFDISINGKDKLTNEKINTYLQECMTKYTTNIHMFGYVFSLAAGISERDIETMLYIKKTYPYLDNYMALVITHCEQFEKEQRDKIIVDFFRHPKIIQSKLHEYFKRGILFMGCLRHESVVTANENAMYLEYNNVFDMRKDFIEKCIASKTPFNFYEGSNANKCRIL